MEDQNFFRKWNFLIRNDHEGSSDATDRGKNGRRNKAAPFGRDREPEKKRQRKGEERVGAGDRAE